MIIYVVYTVVAIILVFVIYIAIKAVNQGIEAKNKSKEENLNFEDNVDNQNIAGSLLKLNDLYKSGDISKEEFLKAKKKILQK